MEHILCVTQLLVDEPQVVWQVLEDYRYNQTDFWNNLLSRTNHSSDCTTTMTADRQSGKSSTFTLLK